LANVLIAILVIALLAGGATFIINYSNQQRSAARALATIVAATNNPLATSTAAAAVEETATRFAIRTATAIARQTPETTPEATLGAGVVTRGGNLRSEPKVADSTVVGLLWAGDQITFLEQRDVGGQTWFRVRVTKPSANRSGDGVPVGTAGWASSVLVSKPTPNP
jgi:hypothetical protein